MSIVITISGDTPEAVREHLRGLLGSTAGGTLVVENPKTFAGGIGANRDHPEPTGAYTQEMTEQFTEQQFASTIEGELAPARERGKPAEGRARRTKAEIAEDEAADAAGATTSVVSETATDTAQQAAISTGEERVNPEDAAQDAADEQAEADAKRDGLTHDDLRQAVGAYSKKYGIKAIVADVPNIIGCAIADVQEGDLAAAIDQLKEALELNPFGHAVVGSTQTEKTVEKVAKAATIDDVKTAMLAYALKYDGQNTDMNAMPITMEDCPAIFKLLFGPECVKLSQVPATAEAYGKVVSGINEAIAKNPFKRGAK